MERRRLVVVGRARASAFVLGCSLTACSLVTSLDGLSTSTTSAADAGVDAPRESAPPSDADLPREGGDAGGPFCTGQTPKPFLCADFDDLELPQPFTRNVLDGKGTLVLDGTKFVSAPRSMLSTIGSGVTSGAAVAVVLPTSTELTIDLDIAIEASGTVGYDILTLHAPGNYEIGLEANGNAISFEDERPLADGGSDVIKMRTGEEIASAFTHVTFRLRRGDGNDAVVDVLVGGTASQFRTLAPNLVTPQLFIGDDTHGSQESGTWRVRYDNVVVRLAPK